MHIARAFLVLSMCVVPTLSHASPVQFTFSDVVDSTTIPGTLVGDSFEIAIVADNGGNTLLSEVWDTSDFVSAVVNIGGAAYTANFLPPVSLGFDATTDAFGNVSTIALVDESTNDTDSLGSSPVILVNGVRNFLFTGDNLRFVVDTVRLTTPDNWTASATSVPAVLEPASLSLLGLGLAGMGARRWRQRKAS